MPASLLDSQFETLESPLGEADVTRIPLDADWNGPLERALAAARGFLADEPPPAGARGR